MSKNLAHSLHPVYDDGKGGGWKWWEWHFVLLNSHISAYATCFAQQVCGLVRSIWVTSLGGDKLGARDRIKVARRARAGQTFPHCVLHWGHQWGDSLELHPVWLPRLPLPKPVLYLYSYPSGFLALNL